MLIEFSGPSASGKTEFVRHLLKTWPETRSVRRSVSPKASPTGPKLKAAASHAHEAPQAFLNAYKWHKHSFGLSRNPVRASLRMAAEYSLLKGLSQDSSLWLLDQGRLQLGSWLPQHICKDPFPHLHTFRNLACFGDCVVLTSLHPDLALTRMIQRGDRDRPERVARERGYKSASDYAIDVYERQHPKRIHLAQSYGCSVLLNVINRHGELAHQEIFGEAALLESVSEQFRAWWRP